MSKLCLAAASLLALAGSASAQTLDWGLITPSGDPDPIIVFDLADPAGSATGLGFVDGNFNRGMDFDTPDSFYHFVSTDALNDPGDRGLWYWSEGLSVQVLTIPFSDSGDGDATLSNDGETFYVALTDDDGIAGDSIYAFTNLSGAVSFVEIGETGLGQLIGLAINPATGLMYGYDTSSEALYLISTTDASATLIGASGESVASIGGMDFNADGSILLLADGSDVLFIVDTEDGGFTAAGDVGFNVSALSFRMPIDGGSCVGDIADDFGNLGADGMVSFGDFLALLGLIGPCPGGVPGCTGDIADDFGNLGGDGMVSFGDFLALLGLIGPCP